MTGTGLTGGGGAVAGADSGTSGIMTDPPPPIPKGLGLDMDVFGLVLKVLFRFLRNV